MKTEYKKVKYHRCPTGKLVCPYCKTKTDVLKEKYAKGLFYYLKEHDEHRCGHCGKKYAFRREEYVKVDYRTCKAPCLNGGEHEPIKGSIYCKFCHEVVY